MTDTSALQQNKLAQIDACLPQTQCGQCDYPRCFDYASAIQTGEAEINQCPPGNNQTIDALAGLLNRPRLPLNPDNGEHQALELAWILESACIGCRLCIVACPVDAIIGAAKLMHTVISGHCTGCKLCLPVCPTDCIDLLPAKLQSPQSDSLWPDFSRLQVTRARQRNQRKLLREQMARDDKARKKTQKQRDTLKLEIEQAVKRSRARRT